MRTGRVGSAAMVENSRGLPKQGTSLDICCETCDPNYKVNNVSVNLGCTWETQKRRGFARSEDDGQNEHVTGARPDCDSRDEFESRMSRGEVNAPACTDMYFFFGFAPSARNFRCVY
jgi:hypothetical protein